MQLSAWNALVTRWIFRTWLLKKAYARERSRANGLEQSLRAWGDFRVDGIGFELRLRKE